MRKQQTSEILHFRGFSWNRCRVVSFIFMKCALNAIMKLIYITVINHNLMEKSMNLIISFSGRENGNCDQIAKYISSSNDDKIIFFRNMNAHECGDCKYECFTSICKYRDDDIYELYGSMCDYDKIYLIVPMYCGNPSSLYFKYNERSQDFFIHNEDSYEIIMKKLYVVGVYGDREKKRNL